MFILMQTTDCTVSPDHTEKGDFMKLFFKLCQQYYSTPYIYAAAIMFFFLCMFGMSARVNGELYSVFELLINPTLMAQAQQKVECNAYLLLLSYSASPWFAVVLPIISAFPALMIYSNYIEPLKLSILSRTNKNCYSASTTAAAFLSGASVSILGTFLYAVLLYNVFPDFSSYGNSSLLIAYGESAVDRLFLLIKQASGNILLCGILAVAAIVLHCLTEDRFLSLTLPMMAMYVSLKLSLFYSQWLFEDPQRYDSKLYKGLYILFPSKLSDAYYIFKGLNVPYYFWLIFIVIILCGLGLLFKRLGTRI